MRIWKKRKVHTQAIQDLDKFLHGKTFGEMCLCISVSAMDALQWMGAVRMRVQTADKNITIIHEWSTWLNFTSQNSPKSSEQICGWILMWETTRDALFHWRWNYGLLFKQWFEVKNVLMMDLCLTSSQLLAHNTLTDGLEWCGLLVDYCDVFISCLDSHSDGTHSLQSIHCWASDGIIHFSKSD